MKFSILVLAVFHLLILQVWSSNPTPCFGVPPCSGNGDSVPSSNTVPDKLRESAVFQLLDINQTMTPTDSPACHCACRGGWFGAECSTCRPGFIPPPTGNCSVCEETRERVGYFCLLRPSTPSPTETNSTPIPTTVPETAATCLSRMTSGSALPLCWTVSYVTLANARLEATTQDVRGRAVEAHPQLLDGLPFATKVVEVALNNKLTEWLADDLGCQHLGVQLAVRSRSSYVSNLSSTLALMNVTVVVVSQNLSRDSTAFQLTYRCIQSSMSLLTHLAPPAVVQLQPPSSLIPKFISDWKISLHPTAMMRVQAFNLSTTTDPGESPCATNVSTTLMEWTPDLVYCGSDSHALLSQEMVQWFLNNSFAQRSLELEQSTFESRLRRLQNGGAAADESAGISTVAVVFIVLGVLACLAVFGRVLFWCFRERRRKEARDHGVQFSSVPWIVQGEEEMNLTVEQITAKGLLQMPSK